MPFPKLATFWSLGVQDSRSALAGMLCLTLAERSEEVQLKISSRTQAAWSCG